jgi:DNA polymerase-3 subunit gamma/tau
MSYLVLARKWRPQTFSDLVGQDHVARTLASAIAQNRVAHAFLFTGVRGVGKTTSARILAKALNCEKGPTAAPCLECSACKEITVGTDVDVQEIDGASNTGVDDVRRIQEHLPYQPQRDRYKILIVDEVHMLSGNAWNAFLKTLEEPPPHVKFIFATTEVHKVPVTILSRCQRYDFKLISASQIADRVRFILGEEKIQADEAAVQIVAREAAGSMRDALSILDQVIAFGGAAEGGLKGDEVARVLGVADRQALHDLASAIVEARATGAIRVIDTLAKSGFDLVHVARDLLRRFRDLAVARVAEGADDLLELADAELADVKSLSGKTSSDDLSRLFQGMSRALDEIARSGTPRASFEMAALRLSRRPPLMPLDVILERLGDLERRLGGASGGGPRPPSGPSGGGGGGGQSRTTSVSAPVARFEPLRAVSTHGPVARAEAIAPAFAEASGEPGAAQSAVSVAPPQPSAILDEPSLSVLKGVVARLREDKPMWGAFLENGVIVRADSQGFEIAYERRSFMAAQVTEPNVARAIERASRAELGAPSRVILADAAPQGTTLAQLASRAKTAAMDAARRAAIAHPAVQEAVAIFGAQVRDVKLP